MVSSVSSCDDDLTGQVNPRKSFLFRDSDILAILLNAVFGVVAQADMEDDEPMICIHFERCRRRSFFRCRGATMLCIRGCSKWLVVAVVHSDSESISLLGKSRIVYLLLTTRKHSYTVIRYALNSGMNFV